MTTTSDPAGGENDADVIEVAFEPPLLLTPGLEASRVIPTGPPPF
jgi:hypothetical protein